MTAIAVLPGRTDEVLVRLGDQFVTEGAAQLHIWGVLLGAHLGAVGRVPGTDVDSLPADVSRHAGELVDAGIWDRTGDGFEIEYDHAARTMRESLDRLNDRWNCVATGATHVRGGEGTCARCGAPRV